MLYLFDIDGTILLTGGAGSVALNAVFEARYQVSGAMDRISAGGKTDPLIVEEIFETVVGKIADAAEVASVIADYEQLLPDAIAKSDNFRLMPNAVDALDLLSADSQAVLGLATGNTEPGARAKLDHAGLWDRFRFGGYGSDSRDRAELVAAALERGISASDGRLSRDEAVVIGDTERDIEAARACGVRVIAVATGSCSREQLAASEPDFLFDTLAELPAWHRQLAG